MITTNELQRLGYSRQGAVLFHQLAKAEGLDGTEEQARARHGQISQDIERRRRKSARIGD